MGFGVQVEDSSVVLLTQSERITHSLQAGAASKAVPADGRAREASAERAAASPPNAFSQQGRRWTQPSAWKRISPAEHPGEATRERARHEPGDLHISRVMVLASSEPQYPSAFFYSPRL